MAASWERQSWGARLAASTPSLPLAALISIFLLELYPTPRAFSTTERFHNDLFDYTAGKWMYKPRACHFQPRFSFNNELRQRERRRVLNVDGLRRLVAQSVVRDIDDIVNLKKLAEGGFNRVFLRMVARIPYLITIPKNLAIASEVATMALFRSSGLPVPEVYGYSSVPDKTRQRPSIPLWSSFKVLVWITCGLT